MSQQQLKAFLEKVKADISLQGRLKAAKSNDEVVSIAKEHGLEFGTEHIRELSEGELESAAGGVVEVEMTCMGLTCEIGSLHTADPKTKWEAKYGINK